MVPPVVSKGSAGLPVLSKKIKLRPTFMATRQVFPALIRSITSKMYAYLRSGLRPEPRWGSLQRSQTT